MNMHICGLPVLGKLAGCRKICGQVGGLEKYLLTYQVWRVGLLYFCGKK